jgi:hypothetical protein
MADFGSPVAQNTAPVTQGVQTLSQIVNLKQQQQGLQLGQQAIAAGAADVQQKQQAMQERLAVQKMMSSGVDDRGQSIVDATGNPDPSKVLPTLGRIAPLTGQQYAQNILKTQSDNVGLQAASTSLDAQQRGMLMGPVQAAALDPNAKSADVNAGIDNLVSAHPEMANAATYLKGLVGHLDNMPPEKRALVVQQIAARMQPGQGVQTQPTAGSVNTGAAQMQGTVAPAVAGGGFTPATQVQNQIPPQIINAPGGIPVVVPGGAKGSITSPASSGSVPATSQDWENFGAYQQNLNSRVAIASDSIPRIQAAEKALDSIRSGAGAQTYANWAKKLQAIGAPQPLVDAVGNGNLGAAQEAEKYLFQTTFSGLRQAMQGDPARVAEFQSAEQVFPSIGTDPRAAKAVLGFMADQSKRDYAEQQALNTARKNGTFNPATWQGDYQQQLRAGKVPGVPASQVPTTGPQVGDKGLSKSGKPIIYRNGQWEYQ